MKKFYLSIEQRNHIINNILQATSDLQEHLDDKANPMTPEKREMAEQAIQQARMLTNLLKVGDDEID